MTKKTEINLVTFGYLLFLTVALFFLATADGHAAEPEQAAVQCPKITTRVVVEDYHGRFTFEACMIVTSYDGETLEVQAHDPGADGLFRNGFDPD